MITRLLIATLLGFTPITVLSLPATQHPFASGDTITLTLDRHALSRLYVGDDKILSLTCPAAHCEVVQNPNDPSGSILLGLNTDDPFTAHMVTERGQLLALAIQPSAQGRSVHRFDLSHSAKDSLIGSYGHRLLRFVTSLMQWSHIGSDPSDMTIRRLSLADPMPHGQTLTLLPLAIGRQSSLSAIVYDVHNVSKTSVSLDNRDFYSPSAVAAALEDTELSPDAHTRLYLVIDREAGHD
ncbi:type-F conjugative transfer system secretin TraK [Vibrio coralliilyticus]|uniref:TraK domain-containing protein n=1 Tax=Vibrio coralliilyticus TaxID=190893 RepID=UPI00391716A2